MAELKDVIACIYSSYPQKAKLSEARLKRMLYLADWRSAITRKKQLTNILWQFGKNGPEPEKAKEQIRILYETNLYNLGEITYFPLTSEDKEIIKHVIETTYKKDWDDLLSLVYSTFPILTQPRFSKLDLVKLADLYKTLQTDLAWNAKTTSDKDTNYL